MSVTSCELMLNARNGSSDEKFQRSYTVKWLVTTNDKNDGPQVVIDGAGGSTPDALPGKYASYAIGNDVDANAYQLTLNVDPYNAGTEYQWVITAEYGPPPKGEAPGDRAENPMLRPVRYSIDWVAFTKPLTKDKDGNTPLFYAIQNKHPSTASLLKQITAKKNDSENYIASPPRISPTEIPSIANDCTRVSTIIGSKSGFSAMSATT